MKFRRCKYEKGQVLIMAVLIMAVLLIGVLLLADIQRIIRGKTTVMSGVDAAAIAGATWQKHTLNLIGELNLIKACTVIISDPSYGIGRGNPDSFMRLNADQRSPRRLKRRLINRIIEQRKQLERSEKLLTEMQVRISFVGPLIGFGAAQQAAKNNKMPSNESCNEYLEMLLNFVRDDDYYGNEDIAPQQYHDYHWRQPYGNMLEKLLASRIAVGTNVEHIGMPHLDSNTKPGRALQYKIIIEAIEGNDWCVLASILTKEMDYSGKWWGDIHIEKNNKFLGCSEILPIHTAFETGESVSNDSSGYNLREDKDEFLKNVAETEKNNKTLLYEKYNKTDIVTEATQEEKNVKQYDPEWRRNHELISVGGTDYVINWEDSDKKLVLPEITWCIFDTSNWRSYAQAEISTAEWEKYLHGHFRPATDYYSGALSYFSVRVPDQTITGKYISSGFSLGKQKAANRLHSSTHYISFDATAKPFGYLKDQSNTFYYPFKAGLILPVFDKVALIPVALEPVSGFAMTDYDWMIFLTKYLPALGTVDSIDDVEKAMNADHFARVQRRGWHDLIKKLNDPAWRQQGIDWLDAPVWKTIWKTRVIGYRDNGDPITERYSEKVQDGTNRDHCFDWSGSSGGTNSRWSPGKLH